MAHLACSVTSLYNTGQNTPTHPSHDITFPTADNGCHNTLRDPSDYHTIRVNPRTAKEPEHEYVL